LELSRIFGKLVKQNWKPARTIILAYWDAEEFALIGSTEHCERFSQSIAQETIAYLNVDTTTGMKDFSISASPNLAQIAREESLRVRLSSQGEETLFDLWSSTNPGSTPSVPSYSSLGSGSDYTAFLQHLGVSSLDISSDGDYGVYHSVFDSYEYVKKFADPDSEICRFTSQFWGLIALRLANDDILPLNNVEYMEFVQKQFQNLLNSSLTRNFVNSLQPTDAHKVDQNFVMLDRDLQVAIDSVKTFYKGLYTTQFTELQRRQVNDKIMRVDRSFIDNKGLKDREWYKHLLFAPGLYLGYGGEVFPGIQAALTRSNLKETLTEIERVRQAIARFIATMK
jgi:hypothetical protein